MGAVAVVLPDLEKHGKALRLNMENFQTKTPACFLVYLGHYFSVSILICFLFFLRIAKPAQVYQREVSAQ